MFPSYRSTKFGTQLVIIILEGVCNENLMFVHSFNPPSPSENDFVLWDPSENVLLMPIVRDSYMNLGWHRLSLYGFQFVFHWVGTTLKIIFLLRLLLGPWILKKKILPCECMELLQKSEIMLYWGMPWGVRKFILKIAVTNAICTISFRKSSNITYKKPLAKKKRPSNHVNLKKH